MASINYRHLSKLNINAPLSTTKLNHLKYSNNNIEINTKAKNYNCKYINAGATIAIATNSIQQQKLNWIFNLNCILLKAEIQQMAFKMKKYQTTAPFKKKYPIIIPFIIASRAINLFLSTKCSNINKFMLKMHWFSFIYSSLFVYY